MSGCHSSSEIKWETRVIRVIACRWFGLSPHVEFRKSQGTREEILARTLDVSGSRRWKEVVWNSSLLSWRKNGTLQPHKWCSDSKIPVIQYTRVSVLWVVGFFFFLKRDTIHFNADASNTELLFRIIHSVIPLSIHGAVSKWCKQFCLTEEERELQRPLARKESATGVLSSVNSQEVKPLVSSPRLASGNSLQKTFRTSNPSLIPFDLQGYA